MRYRVASAMFGVAAVWAGVLAAAEPPKLKLDDAVRPIRYVVDLTLLTDAPVFSGSVEIEIQAKAPASLIWINASEIEIQSASLEAGGRTLAASVEPGNQDFVGLRFPEAVPAGTGRLRIRYQGKINTKSSAGIFQGRDGANSYLFSQFETTDARRAIPCFDQPDFKTPWQLTVHVKKENAAISNTPEASATEEADGMKRVVFAPTKPLPSYLVALAVGPFDIVDGGVTGKNHIPVRIIAPKGKAAQAKYAAEVTGAIIQRLENYFGIPFPYEKSDQVAIPLTFGFGAMENAGMVTYASTLILSDPAIDTLQRQRGYASVAAHELAHQWFGDLVTLAWWDDTWLNEAFATWTSAKIIAEWKPEWNWRLSDLGSKFGAMTDDSLVSARQIRQPIESMDDISNAFDGITYEKGAAVIRMFETWVGEKQFQKGVNAYLKRYADKNATVNDFLDAIAGTGQPRLTKAFSTFLEQPGFPEVSVRLKCDGAPRLAVSQKRFLPIGSAGSKDQTWHTPICVRYQTDRGPQKECFLLDGREAEFPLTKASACPAYLSANDGASGYYVAAYESALLSKLLNQDGDFLDAAERRTLLHDLRSLVVAGDAKPAQALEAVFRFAKAPERQVMMEAVTTAGAVRNLVPGDLTPNYGRYVHKAFGEKASALGWTAKPGEDQETRLLRASLVPFVATVGADAGLRSEARRMAGAWLADRQGIQPDMLNAVLTTAADSGDRALFDTILRELKKTEDRHLRSLMIGSLGRFRDPKLAAEAMDLIMRPELDVKETVYVLFAPLGTLETQRVPFDFVKTNYDALLKRLPATGSFDGAALLPLVGQGFCDEASRKEFTAFFEDRVKTAIGAPRYFTQALEAIRLCEAQKAAQGADVAAFLARQ